VDYEKLDDYERDAIDVESERDLEAFEIALATSVATRIARSRAIERERAFAFERARTSY